MKTIDNSRKMRGSTLPELLTAMVVCGLVLLFAYEGLSLIQKRLGSAERNSASWQLIRADAVVETLMRQADSIIISGSDLLFYSSGIPSDTLSADRESIAYRKETSGEILFPNAAWVVTGYAGGCGNQVKLLEIFLMDSGEDTLRLTYKAGNREYIEALHDY